jgi:hypothetical protein
MGRRGGVRVFDRVFVCVIDIFVGLDHLVVEGFPVPAVNIVRTPDVAL